MDPEFFFLNLPGHVRIREEVVPMGEVFFEAREVGLEGIDELEDVLGVRLGSGLFFFLSLP